MTQPTGPTPQDPQPPASGAQPPPPTGYPPPEGHPPPPSPPSAYPPSSPGYYPPPPGYPPPPAGYPVPPGYPPQSSGYPPPPGGTLWQPTPTPYFGRLRPAPGLLYAGTGLRILGALIDVVINFAIYRVVIAVAAASGAGVIALVALAALVALNVWVPGRFGGTVGMLMCSMRILRQADGSPIGYGLATGRWFAYLLVNIIPIIMPIINLIVMATDRRHQAIHDKICSTVVVRPG